MNARASFHRPPGANRPVPLWAFNAPVSRGELARQIRELARAGYGGFFIHPRIGLETPFLSAAWMDLVAHCVREAKRHGLHAWLYDEDRWPSGFAGGLLLDRHPEFRVRELLWGEGFDLARAQAAARARAFVPAGPAGPGDPGRFEPFLEFVRAGTGWPWRRLARGARVPRGGTFLAFVIHEDGDSDWFGGRSYPDLLNPAAVRALLRLAWDPYARRFGKEFGRTIPGIFTDEPMLASWYARGLPWTPGFERVLARALPHGLADLPALAAGGPGTEAIRHAFVAALAARFRESFAAQVGRWCRRHGLALTGHWLDEDGLWSQTRTAGAVMPLYAHQGIPGIDHLRLQAGHRLTLAQVASAARQLGKRRILSELYGVAGHGLTFADQKWLADWHLVHGIGLLCPHLVLQSMAGDRKRDYPPTFSWHAPWWSDQRLPNVYAARLAAVLERGRPEARVLVLHPVAGAWATMDWAGEPAAAKRVQSELERLMESLVACGRGFDLGDETLLAAHARIRGRALVVGRAAPYRAVIVPPSPNWSGSTLNLLAALVRRGVPVWFAGPLPVRVDGHPAAARWRAIARRARRLVGLRDARRVDGALAAGGVARDLRWNGGRPASGLAALHTREGTTHRYFVVNRHRTRGTKVGLELVGAGRVTRWDATRAGIQPVTAVPTRLDGAPAVRLALDLPAAGSDLIVIEPGPPVRTRAVPPRQGRVLRLGSPVAVTPSEPNLLVLDRCRFTVDGAGDGRLRPVFAARRAAFRAAGMERAAGLQPWRRRELGLTPARTVRIALEYEFRLSMRRVPLALVLETPAAWGVTLNGAPVPVTPSRPWRGDPLLRLIPLPAAGIRRGKNILRVMGTVGSDVSIEDLFLVGAFRVAGPATGPHRLEAPRAPGLGDWTRQGYRFFPGWMTYRFAAAIPATGRWTLRLGCGQATVYRVRVDGRHRGPVGWAPWEADLGRLRAGRHALEVDAVGSLANAFGPLHNTRLRRDGGWISPESFTDPDHWTHRYLVRSYGLAAPPVLFPSRQG